MRFSLQARLFLTLGTKLIHKEFYLIRENVLTWYEQPRSWSMSHQDMITSLSISIKKRLYAAVMYH